MDINIWNKADDNGNVKGRDTLVEKNDIVEW
jgi:hypothetical protein